jgi:lipoprotein NlpI
VPAYYNRANTYNVLEETEKAIADLDAALAINPNYAGGYTNRGAVFLIKGETRSAIADFDAAVRLTPTSAFALNNRGSAYLVLREYDRALDDFDEAVRLQPHQAWAFGNRGIARFYSGRTEAGIADLVTAAELSPTDALLLIWLHFLRARTGQDDSNDFTIRAAKIDRTKWPGAVIDLYLGVVEPNVIRAAVLSGGTKSVQRRRICEINFYLATYYLQRDTPEARTNLDDAASNCSPGTIELVAAKAELHGLQAKP